MTKNKHRKERKGFKAFNKILCIISIVITLIFIFILFKSNIIPIKYFIIIISVLAIINIIYAIFSFKWNNKYKTLIFMDIIIILLIISQVIIGAKINETINFLNKNMQAQYNTDIYYIIVNKDSKYQELSMIEGKTIYSYNDLEDIASLEEAVKEQVNVRFEYVDNSIELINSVLENNDKIILINSGTYEAILDINENYEKQTKILTTIKIKTKIKEVATTADIVKKPFVIYLSGIDTRTNSMPARSLSDVNMFLVVNPKTKTLLMVNIPRDYFVKLHGTTGLNDKLTHAGSLGGIEMSKATVEDILETNADYYVRVNFNSVIKLVDAIDGITLYSDVDYSFTGLNYKNCTFNPGDNKVNGECALAFARERYAYQEGDRHRGENQEQVIEKILDKITSSPELVSNYSDILNALDGTFETNISTNDITSLIKFVINDSSKWNVKTSNLDGTGGMSVTYASPNRQLYVMYPDQTTINDAKYQIKQVLEN